MHVNASVAIYLCSLMVFLGLVCTWGQLRQKRENK